MRCLLLVVLLAGCVEADYEVPRSAPATSWQLNEAQDSASLIAVEGPADWSDFAIRFDVPGQIDRDGRVQAVGNHDVRLTPGSMAAGDRLGFCTDVGGELEASMSHPATNTLVRNFRFSDVQRC